MKKLPDTPVVNVFIPLNKPRYSDMTALAYMTADACYQMLHECTNMLLLSKQDYRADSKRRFNQFFEAMENARKCALRVGDDISIMGDNQINYFFEDSDFLKDSLVSVYNKTKNGNKENEVKIKDFINSL